MKFSRRDFLTFAGFTVVGAFGGRYLRNQLLPHESYYLGNSFKQRKETFHAGLCGMCPAGCGIRVRQVDGLAVKIDGNPDCPISRGRLCPKGQMGLELHYNPDRISSPLKRVGPSGSSHWEKVSWDEGLSLLSARVQTAVQSTAAGGVVALCNDEQSIGSTLWSRFQEKYAARCSLVRLNQLRDYSIRLALKSTVDSFEWPVYDFENSDFLLVFDTPLVSGWGSPALMIGKYANFRRGGGRTRGQMVFVGSRRSMDAANADSYVQVKPYTSAILAFGLAHVIIRERRYDEQFVAQHCRGFEELKSVILKYFKPKTVSEMTGVPIETINSVARRFADSSSPIAIGERIPERSETWEQTAYLTLNALKGSFGRSGGVLLQEHLGFGDIQPPELSDENLQNQDVSPFERFVANILDNDSAPDVLLVDKVSPAASLCSGGEWTTALERIPFVVSFSPYPDYITSHADLVLPDLGFLEKSSDLVHSPALGYPTVSVTDAAAAQIGDGIDTRLVQLHLIDESYVTDGAIDRIGKEKQLQKMRTDFHRNIFGAARGLVYDTPFAREWVRRMESGGWWASETDDFTKFDEQLQLKGGWTDPYIPENNGAHGILGSSRRFNFTGVLEAIPLERILSSRIESPPPDFGDGQWTRLTVVPVTLLALSALPYGNVPHLLEFPEPGVISGWEPWLELHSSVAERLHLKNEDNVEIESHKQMRRCRVIINDNLHADIGAVPFGMFGLGEGSWILENMKRPLESIATTERDHRTKGIVVRIRKV